VPKPGGEMPEGKVPPAFEKNGANDWKKFWARVKSELGLTAEQARELLHVDSIKEELVDAGWSMENEGKLVWQNYHFVGDWQRTEKPSSGV
jgi:hypothetical protein